MIKHLEDSSILIGKNKQAVIIFLGEDFDENCYGKDTLCFVVNDPDNYAFLDHYEFIVFFDENGIVN